MKRHLDLVENDPNHIYDGDDFKITFLKRDLLKSIGFSDVEHRMKSYGWDTLHPLVLDTKPYLQKLSQEFGNTTSSVTWNQQIADLLGVDPSTNYSYGK